MTLPAWRRALLPALAALALVFVWSSWISGAPARADAEQNLRAAMELGLDGRFPGMFREPLPIAIDAVGVAVIQATAGPAAYDAWVEGPRIAALKRVNLFWLGLLSVAAFLSARTLGAGRIGAWTALALVNLIAFVLRTEFVDSLGTDLMAAALLTTAAGLTASGWTRQDVRRLAAGGFVLGLACLTKASLLYVAIGLALALLLLAAWRRRGWPDRARRRQVLILLAAVLLATTPWMLRNLVHAGEFSIADRGGEVLLLRAYEDQVTPAEYAGVWCAYSPGRLQAIVCPLTGHSQADLRPGGSLGRFSRATPSDPRAVQAAAEAGAGPVAGLSFYHTAKERFRVLNGRLRSTTAADTRARAEAFALIAAAPGRHLAMTPAFLWRGLGGLTVILLGIGAVALVRKHDGLVVFLLPFVGLGFFMALFSHFIPRYAWPMIPAACVVLPLTVEAVLRRAVRR